MNLDKLKAKAGQFNINISPATPKVEESPATPVVEKTPAKPWSPPVITPSTAAPPKVAVRPISGVTPIVATPKDTPEWAIIRDAQGNVIYLDNDQQKAVRMARDGLSFAMIGKAGTGKTTTVQAMILAMLQSHATKLKTIDYRIKGLGESVPAISIGVVAFANRAANNIRNKAQAHPDLKEIMDFNVTTLHNMLWYTVEFYDDPETGKTKRRYYPQKDEVNQLELDVLFVEEASMVAVGDQSIWAEMFAALPAGCQVIFLGDSNQLPPVGGKPVLAYAMQQLPVVELTHVHRQALDNPIIRQALNCLEGKMVEQDYIEENGKEGKGVRVLDPAKVLKQPLNIKLQAYKYRLAAESLCRNMMKLKQYDPYQDIILCPNNKHEDHLVSTKEFNAQIAWQLAQDNKREVYEIKAGFNTVYLAVGDKVMVDKYEGVVQKIATNGNYIGSYPNPPSRNMDYKGNLHGVGHDGALDDIVLDGTANYEALDLDEIVNADPQDEKTRAASHIVDVMLDDGERIVTLSSAGDYGDANFSLGYAISVHKAQGSEWRNVIVALHDSARSLLFRELLYTGMTRAINRLDIIAQPHTLKNVIGNPRIKGNSLADKIEFFNSGYLDQIVPLIPGVDSYNEDDENNPGEEGD